MEALICLSVFVVVSSIWVYYTTKSVGWVEQGIPNFYPHKPGLTIGSVSIASETQRRTENPDSDCFESQSLHRRKHPCNPLHQQSISHPNKSTNSRRDLQIPTTYSDQGCS